MTDKKEDNLKLFEIEAKRILREEAKNIRNNTKYKNSNRIKRKTNTFLKNNNLVIVPSDKSNRIVISNENSITERTGTENLLKDTKIYSLRNKSKASSIENQANRLVRGKCSKLQRINHEKLLTSGSHPAAFQINIKDHKEKVNGFHPLRPIASTINTPTQKVDWLASILLNQLVKFVPSHLDSTNALIECLRNNNDKLNNTDNCVFISLDVINLYPSIPIEDGLKVVEDFARQYWSSIDNYGLNVEDLIDFLKFIAYNYEITYNQKTYLQIEGCPMGTHISPPFSIIYIYIIFLS